MKGCSVVVDSGASLLIKDCTFPGCHVAVLATGAKSTAHITACCIDTCDHAFCAEVDAWIAATQMQVHGCCGTAMDVRARARLSLVDCNISETKAFAVAVRGAVAKLQDCTVTASRLAGLIVVGTGSTLAAMAAMGCTVNENAQDGICVREGAAAKLHGCTLTGNKLQGAQVSGDGSLLTASSCKVSSNESSGVWVRGDGAAALQDCRLIGNRMQGAEVSGAGSTLTASSCKMSHNEKSGVWVHGNGAATLQDCTLTANGADLKGARSTLKMQACTARDNALLPDVMASDGAILVQNNHESRRMLQSSV